MKSGNTARKASLVLASILFIASGATSSWAAPVNTDGEAKCFKTLTKSISKHASNIVKAMNACNTRVYEGESVSCPDADALEAIEKSAASAHKGVTKKCGSTCSGPTALSCIADTTCPPNGSIPEFCSGDGTFNYVTMGFPGSLCPGILGVPFDGPEDYGQCVAAEDNGLGAAVGNVLVENIIGGLTGTPALSESAAGCLSSIAKNLPKNLSKLAGTVSKCRIRQLTLDTAEILVDSCDSADAKTVEGIEATVLKFRDSVAGSCNDGAVAELDLCGGTANTLAEAQDCLELVLREASYSIESADERTFATVSVINAAFPGTSPARCGDNFANQRASQFFPNGEECDGTDDSACPGKCLPPGDTFQCTCSSIARARGFAYGAQADLDNGWSGKSHNSKVTDGAGFVSTVTGCDCSAFDPVDKATCLAGQSSDPICNVDGQTAPRCGRRIDIDDPTSCDDAGDNNGVHHNDDCSACDANTTEPLKYCTGLARFCLGGTSDGTRCNDATDCPGGSCSADGTCATGPNAGAGCNNSAGCSGNPCVKTSCVSGSNDGTPCDADADCTGGGRCATTTDCTAQCYQEGNPTPTGTCARQSDCAEGERCKGICDVSDECVILRNGAPLPLSANGTSVCIDSQFFSNIEGTRNIYTGEHAISYELRSIIYLAGNKELNSRPCPVCGGFCDGDITPTGLQPSSFLCDGSCTTDPQLECRFGKNIGDNCTSNADCLGELCAAKRCRFDDDCAVGICSGEDAPECTRGTGDCVLALQCGGGTTPNQACRIEANTAFGTTSSDCKQSGSNITNTGLSIVWDPLTSEAVENQQQGACDQTGYWNYDCNCVSGGGSTRNQPVGCTAACTDPDPEYYGKACSAFTTCVADGCVGGSNHGGICTTNAECPGTGAVCTAANTSYRGCIGGANDKMPCSGGFLDCPGGSCPVAANYFRGSGRACDEDGDCASGDCGGNPRVCGDGSNGLCSIRRCTGGSNPGAICTQNSACFGGGTCPTAATCIVGGAACAEGNCTPANCVTAATCTNGATCDDACPNGLCTPMCVPKGICVGGDRDGQRCGIDEKCIGGGDCVPEDPEEGACAQGNFYHCDGPGWLFKLCAPGNVNTQIECEAGTDGTLGTGDDNRGAGFCRADILNCFINNGAAEGGDTLNGKGDPTNTLSVATFCIPPSESDAVNGTAGLPGPGRIRQPALVVPNFTELPVAP